MAKGTVKWFNSRKGFGFITTEENQDIFVHYTAIKSDQDEFKTIYEGDIVEFEIIDGQKGPQASDVRVIEKGPREQRYQSRGRSNRY